MRDAPGGRLMAVSPFYGPPAAGLYGDPEVARCSPHPAEIRSMLLVEGALAEAQAALGIIPDVGASAIARASREVTIDPAELAEGMAGSGVPVAALVKAFRRTLDPEHGAWLHWGATCQDVVDTGLVLRLRRVLAILDTRLERLAARLADQAERHRETVIAARTRYQIATPTTLGAKIAVWGLPLLRHEPGSPSSSRGCCRVSLGGASCTNAALEGRGPEVMRALAADSTWRGPRCRGTPPATRWPSSGAGCRWSPAVSARSART